MGKIYCGVSKQQFRDDWVEGELTSLRGAFGAKPRLLDAGAGQQPYISLIEFLGYEYYSQDFNSYSPDSSQGGFHLPWPHKEHDYVCDILEIPVSNPFDLILCTEVLEHVPDPIATVRHLTKLLRTGAFLITTAPLLSLVHQAPFHFSSGLTEFWYQRWLPARGLNLIKLERHGDYADFFAQEVRRFANLPGISQRPIASIVRMLSGRNPGSAAGFSVFTVSRKAA